MPQRVVLYDSGEKIDQPKSENLISPSSRRMFSGFMSQWITFLLCKYYVAKIHYFIILLTVYSGNHLRGCFVIVSNNSPLDAYSKI